MQRANKEDYYINEDGKVVFTKEYHLNRGHCCGSGCKHCPYVPKHTKGNTNHKDSDLIEMVSGWWERTGHKLYPYAILKDLQDNVLKKFNR